MFNRIYQTLKKFFINTNIGGYRRLSGSYNNSSREQITDYKLIEHYKRFAYACAQISAGQMARVQLKLYVKTSNGQSQPRVKTAPVSDQKYAYISEKFNLNKNYVRDLQEVTEHPVLELFQRANDSPFINGYLLKYWTFLYLEVTGRCYWLKENGLFGQPLNLWLLPSQYVFPYREVESKDLITYYKYYGEGIQHNYYPQEIVQFLIPNLINPYIWGTSGLEAGFEASSVSNKLMAHQISFFDNEARPDFILSPKDPENTIGEDEAEKWEKQFISKFGRGRSGKVFVPNEAVTLQPITWPPKDLADLQISQEAKKEISNVMGVPIVLLEGDKANKQVLDGALSQLALLKVAPTLDLVQSIYNDQILPLYDDSGRLMLCYDNCVPEDATAKLAEVVQLKANGITTPNEARDRYNYPAMSGGDTRETQNVAGSGGKERQASRDNGTASK